MSTGNNSERLQQNNEVLATITDDILQLQTTAKYNDVDVTYELLTDGVSFDIDSNGFDFCVSPDAEYIVITNSLGIVTITSLKDMSSFSISFADYGITKTALKVSLSIPTENNERYIAFNEGKPNGAVYYIKYNFTTNEVVKYGGIPIGLSDGTYAHCEIAPANIHPNWVFINGLHHGSSYSYVGLANLETETISNATSGQWFTNIVIDKLDRWVTLTYTNAGYIISEDGQLQGSLSWPGNQYALNSECEQAWDPKTGGVYKYSYDESTHSITIGDYSYNTNLQYGIGLQPSDQVSAEAAFINENTFGAAGVGVWHKNIQINDSVTYSTYKRKNQGLNGVDYITYADNKITLYASFNTNKIKSIEFRGSDFVNTTDATALAEDIVQGKTAFINNEEVTGTLPITERLEVGYKGHQSSEGSLLNIQASVDKTVVDGVVVINNIPDQNLAVTLKVKPEKLLKDYKLFGVTGTLDPLDTTDATATSSDILAPKTAYANGVKVTGSIEVEEQGTDYAFNARALNTSESLYDYRADLGLALRISGKTLYIYEVNKASNTVALILTHTMSIAGNATDVVFAKEPIINDETNLVYNIYVGMGYVSGYELYQGLAVLRYNVNTKQMYSDSSNSATLQKTHKLVGWAYTNHNLGAPSMTVLPIGSKNVVLTQSTPGYDSLNSTSYHQGQAWLATVNGTGISTVTIAHRNGTQRHTISHKGNLLMSRSSSESIFYIYRFYNSFVNYTTVKTGSISTSYPILLDDKFIWDGKLYTETGTVIKEYESLPFNSASSYKFYITGYIIELVPSTTTVYTYKFDTDTYEITADGTYTGLISNYIAYNGTNNLKQFPKVHENGIALWNGTSTLFNCMESLEGGTIITAIERDGIRYQSLSSATISNSNQLLRGVSVYGSTGKIDGTMANNGSLSITPQTVSQSLPAGYISGGTVSKVDSLIDSNISAENIKEGVTILGVTGTVQEGVMTQEEYDTCDNLANLILSDTPILDDPYISVTLNVTDNDSIKVENDTLIIEEVTE